MASDPFKRYPQVDEGNYLDVNIRHLLGEAIPALLNTAIEKLVVTRDVLRVAQKAGKLDQIAHRTYYMQAVQWLNKQLALSTWSAVPQITGLEQVDENIASQFDQYVSSLITSLQGESTYAQIETMIALNAALRRKPYDDIGAEAEEKIRSDVTDIGERAIREITAKQSELDTKLDEKITSSEAQFNQTVKTSITTIRDETDNAVGQLKQAQSLKYWGEAYDELIEELETRINGRKFEVGLLSRNFANFKHLYSDVEFTRISIVTDPFVFLYKIMPFISRNMNSWLRVRWSKLISYKSQRTTAFLLLALFGLTFSAVSILSLKGVEALDFLNPTEDGVWYKKLAMYLPAVIILGIAYSYTVKNFRIYSNMLDQYKHRRLVARTAQGIILSLNSDDTNIRNTMTAAAAQALFEHKNTGHLSKKEAESMSILELLNINRTG